MTTVTTDDVVSYLIDNGGSVTYSEMKRKFSKFLISDNNKLIFKDILKKIATITSKNGEKTISIKEKYREKKKKEDETPQISTPKNENSEKKPIQPRVRPVSRPNSAKSINMEELSTHKQWFLASSAGDIALMKKLLENNPELVDDSDVLLGYNAFYWAAATGKCDVIIFLAELKNAEQAINRLNRSGHTPLHVAYIHDRRPAAQTLERCGANAQIEDFNCRVPSYYLDYYKKRIDQEELDFENMSPPLSATGKPRSFANKLAAKVRETLRSISSSNSSIDSIASCSSRSSTLQRPRSGDIYGLGSDKGYFNRCSQRWSASGPKLRHHFRGLSSSSGALNGAMQLTPHITTTYNPHLSKSSDLSPIKDVQYDKRKSTELMPPPPKPNKVV